MPTYVYKFVDSGETIEIQQSFSDDALTVAPHPETGDLLPVKKVFTPVGVTFKGSGFYKTDNRGGSKSKSSSGAGTSEHSSGSSSDSSSSDTKTSTKDSGSTTASSSGSGASTGTTGSSSSD